MARRWSAFSAQEQDVGVSRLRSEWSILLIAGLFFTSLVLVSTRAFRAAEAAEAENGEPVAEATPLLTPAATPSAELDQSFLLLPAFDVENASVGKSIRVGDSITLRLQGDVKGLPPELKISLPTGTEDISTTIDLEDRVTGEDHHFNATAVKVGEVTVPSLALTDASGRMVARTNPFKLGIESSISKTDPKPKEAQPALPPTGLGLPLATLIAMGVVILLILGAGIYALVRWSRKRKQNAPAKPKAPPLPEDQLAIQALERLEKSGYIRTAQFKAHYFGISEILKHYVGSRYHFDAAESTTAEMLTHLERESGAPSADLIRLRDIYEKLDLVKFTDHRPSLAEGNELILDAKKFVLSTKRLPMIVTPNSPKSSKSTGSSSRVSGAVKR